MINKRIDAIFIDHGGTLRVFEKDEAFENSIRDQIVELIEPVSPDNLFKQLEERYKIYKQREHGTLLQDSGVEIWTHWMLPDYPADKIAPLANQLTVLWRGRKGRQVLRPNAKQIIIELSNRGYILGIIANSFSETEIPERLEADGISQYFKSVVLSAKFGRRKPDQHIYREAAYLAGVKPENCAYVGDNPNTDIEGAQRAGFGVTIILSEPDTLKNEIREISDLLTVFPRR
jgi:HAD superfamily hydrolase (TIGR01509 family)